MTSLLRRLNATSPLSADLGLLIVRLWFGGVMAAAHGYGKVMNISGFSENVAKMGFPMPTVLGSAAALSEFVGGILLALGLMTRPAAGALLGTMIVAAFVVHADDPFAKKEFALCYGAAALALLLSGPGRFSIDARMGRR